MEEGRAGDTQRQRQSSWSASGCGSEIRVPVRGTHVRRKLGHQECQLRMIPHQALDTLGVRLRLGFDPFSTQSNKLVHVSSECLWVSVAEMVGDVAEQLWSEVGDGSGPFGREGQKVGLAMSAITSFVWLCWVGSEQSHHVCSELCNGPIMCLRALLCG
jgi:hypothetical protein